ncbi:AraC family transcriptional regulator [Arsukibacterium sp.]|uniref:AraC family transcriptional regulator n=1 Tax=Arsukibacterium sp. TaxID=1977258 RepID=UPI00299DC884|nr:AraC family transcriptional regulator ligand-binding domain-containing protein [Arsukibacterium sp.]MDX1537035.1 AraC family transcriptional regulator ligand-binding domain-containing protein [Arsukibacterium sp.]
MQQRSFGYQDKILLLQHGSSELLALAQRRGASLSKLLTGTGIFEQDLHKPHGRLHHNDWLKLLQNCQQLNSPELPFLLGSAIVNSRYISLCQSLQAAANLRQALSQLCYFRHQLFPAVYPTVYLQPSQQTITLELQPAAGLNNQQPFMIILVFSLVLALIRQQLATSSGIRVQLQAPCNGQQLQYQLHWGCQISFSQPCNSISIPLPLWQQPFADANAERFRAARRSCLQLNRVLPRQRGLLEQVCRLQQRALPQLLTLEQAAGALGMTGNSLKRQLSLHQTNFARLLDQIRRDQARRLLQQGRYSNRQLAQQLGYSDEHNFRRAFKRWTGLLPSDVKGLLNFN